MLILISIMIKANVKDGDLNDVHGFMLEENDITETPVVNFNIQVMKYRVMRELIS